MPQQSQEALYQKQREQRAQQERDAAAAKQRGPVTFQQQPLSDLVRASEKARMLPSRNVPPQGRLIVPPALLALLGLE